MAGTIAGLPCAIITASMTMVRLHDQMTGKLIK
jgi:hypothetical protein